MDSTLFSSSRLAPGASTALPDAAAALLVAAKMLLAELELGRAIDTQALRTAMTAAFGGSDAEGVWDWKTAYDACEAAQVLFLRKFGPAMRARAGSCAASARHAGEDRGPGARRTRAARRRAKRSSSSRPLSRSASRRAPPPRSHAADLVLEPSAGTGLLAILAELAGGSLVLNELADTRANLLAHLFPGVTVTRHDAAHIHDHLDAALRPTVVLMNPPFSVAAHVDGRVADAALRHISSALARLVEGGRLVAITGDELLSRKSNLARRLHSAARARPRRVHCRRRWPCLCSPRHHHRHASDRYRPRAGRRSHDFPRLAGHRVRSRHVAGLGDAACPAAACCCGSIHWTCSSTNWQPNAVPAAGPPHHRTEYSRCGRRAHWCRTRITR